MSDWSRLSSIVFSQASDALTEAKQRVQAISQNDLDPQNIDWSKISGSVLSRASDALTEAKQLVNQAASQNDIDLQNVDWSRLSDKVVSHASDALTDAKQLANQAMLQKHVDLTNIDWSKVSGNILSHASSALTEIDNWSISHSYESAGALLFISALTHPAIILASLQLMGSTAVFMCFIPVRLTTWYFGFRSGGVAKGSLASQYQSSHYGGHVPRSSGFAKLQSYGATMPTVTSTLVSLLSYAGAVIILGRKWGWWLR
ncbi:hypothetical protein DEU56DRAFT_77757 [Suillus clintonianus]|uniref:uncharacterized protein n=1 Tax=Suillus clintonianus TaxID=1904413 RepID=UPI001B87B13E|nr:uncharacterized protein DEU56DRAFT_77757 [Suillus clintonianus]KAG2122237.1 hypothetical protein DEU56DRAFT_77757 [Suillus clintonianus]